MGFAEFIEFLKAYDAEIKSLTIIATLITSIVSLGTLWNATKQRLTANRPEIHVKRKNYFTQLLGRNLFHNIGDKDGEERFALPVYNIGLGVAKNIEIKWDLNEVVRKIQEANVGNHYEINYDKNKQTLIIQGDMLINMKAELVQEVDFMLPHKSDNKANDLLEVPVAMMLVHGIYAELYEKHKFESRGKWESMDFSIEISYKDVHNKSYNRKINAKIGLSQLGGSPKEFSGFIEIL